MRFVWLCLLCGVMNGLPARAQEGQRNALTPQEIESGWILLFDGETTFGWKPRGESVWRAAEGAIQASEGGTGTLSTTTEFADFELRAECWIDEKANSGLFLRAPTDGPITPDNAYEVNIYDAHPQWPTGSINGVARARGRHRSVGRWTAFAVRAEGGHLIVEVDRRRTVDAHDRRHARGVIALQYNGAGTVRFRNVRLRPLGLKSLFNGKDLTGWKPLPGRSVFSVTPEGWLNVKNGSGDLQTESVWGDFVLQLDIFSNGEHLNSGVFFRANPGRFWSGYESQIRNQWEDDDRTKAVDYGTGGIYNRQPARKVVSNDHEWFTMTVTAHGLHMAVWVNGYPVSDFTDTRPPDETNARRGARTKPGVISIQGHDPTTDLSFRSIRIVELPAVGR